MKTAPDRKKQADLDRETAEVFRLLEKAAEQYRAYLLSEEELGGGGLWAPSADDYTWDKPLTFAFTC